MKMPTTIRLAAAFVLASLALEGQSVVAPTPDRPDDIEKAGVYTMALPGFKWAKEPDRVSHSGSRWR